MSTKIKVARIALCAAGDDAGGARSQRGCPTTGHIQAGKWCCSTNDTVEVGLAAALIERQAKRTIDRAAKSDVAVGAVERRGRTEGGRAGVGLRAAGGDAASQRAGAGNA